MSTEKSKPEIEAEVLSEIRDACEEYFHNQFPKDRDSIKGFADVEKLTGEFLAKKLKAVESKCEDVDDIKIIVASGSVMCPVLRVASATWKVGGLFKKTVKGVFFVWHPEITDMSECITIAELNGFLNSNGFDDPSASVNWVATAPSKMDVKVLRETLTRGVPWFSGATCDINYNLKSLTFDNAKKALVLKVEERGW